MVKLRMHGSAQDKETRMSRIHQDEHRLRSAKISKLLFALTCSMFIIADGRGFFNL